MADLAGPCNKKKETQEDREIRDPTLNIPQNPHSLTADDVEKLKQGKVLCHLIQKQQESDRKMKNMQFLYEWYP